MLNFYSTTLFFLITLASLLDIQRRQIPNALTVCIVFLWLTYAFWRPDADPLGSLAVAAAVLAAGMLFWRLGWLGGGDAKLIAALSLWAGPEHTLPMVSVVALGGGALAMALIVARQPAVTFLLAYASLHLRGARTGNVSISEKFNDGTADGRAVNADLLAVPYGVAIAAGGCWLIHRLFIG
jgi:Flp pilus assembly protein protease CpaA